MIDIKNIDSDADCIIINFKCNSNLDIDQFANEYKASVSADLFKKTIILNVENLDIIEFKDMNKHGLTESL